MLNVLSLYQCATSLCVSSCAYLHEREDLSALMHGLQIETAAVDDSSQPGCDRLCDLESITALTASSATRLNF